MGSLEETASPTESTPGPALASQVKGRCQTVGAHDGLGSEMRAMVDGIDGILMLIDLWTSSATRQGVRARHGIDVTTTGLERPGPLGRQALCWSPPPVALDLN